MNPYVKHVFVFSVFSGNLTSWALVDLGETAPPSLVNSFFF